MRYWLQLALACGLGCGRINFDVRGDAGDAGDVQTDACVFGPFNMPTNLGIVNTASNEYAPALRADGLELVFESDRVGGRHLYSASRASQLDSFGGVVRLDVLNSASIDVDPAYVEDGLTLYFASSRNGPSQLFVTTRLTKADAWNAPMLVSDLMNEDMHGPTLAFDGNELFYNHEAPAEELVRAHRGSSWIVDGPVTELNQSVSGYPSLSHDGRSLFYMNGAGTTPRIEEATRPDGVTAFTHAAVDLQTPASSSDDDPEIADDGRLLLFSSDRPGGAGAMDFWMATRSCM